MLTQTGKTHAIFKLLLYHNINGYNLSMRAKRTESDGKKGGRERRRERVNEKGERERERERR